MALSNRSLPLNFSKTALTLESLMNNPSSVAEFFRFSKGSLALYHYTEELANYHKLNYNYRE